MLGAIVIAVSAGIAIRYLLKLADRKDWMDHHSILVLSISLSLMTIGAFARLGIDEILGCFVLGVTISWDQWFTKQLAQSYVQEIIDVLLNMCYFIYVGSQIPWASLVNVPGTPFWRIVLCAILILFFRRMPFVYLLQKFIPALKTPKDVLLCGWFGPIGYFLD